MAIAVRRRILRSPPILARFPMADAPFEQETRFDHDVDPEPYLRACPPEATTRGTFFQHIYDAGAALSSSDRERLFDGLERRSWFPFKSYPLTEFMRLAYNAARVLHADRSTAEGLRRVGWLSYPSFASTLAGRVVLFALGNHLEDVVRACPAAYRQGLPLARVHVKPLGERHWEFEMWNVHSFVDTYHCGVLEGAIRAFRFRPEVSVEPMSRCNARFIAKWE
jgi:uncharacterized protein (TIGR02265 family)